jgi:hypothetical protein
MVRKVGFINIQYFNKYPFVSVETFMIFYGSSGLYVGRVSGKKVCHLHKNNIAGFRDFGIPNGFLGFEIRKNPLFLPWITGSESDMQAQVKGVLCQTGRFFGFPSDFRGKNTTPIRM